MKNYFLVLSLLWSIVGLAQTNISITDATAAQILHGEYNPNSFAAPVVIDDHQDIVQGIQNNINPDSLKAYIQALGSFGNRNTGSDTISDNKGIGAARRWAFHKFEQFSALRDNRLQTTYLQFDQFTCNMNQHRNVLTVLPGSDTSNHEIIIIEGHMDSRCAGRCDTACVAEGIEDNATGSALVLELARVMSRYTFKNTIVFMLTTGEEQGLRGAGAFSRYCIIEDLPVKAVLNNDVIGGVICGATSSPPSCPGLNEVDSTHVRLFSEGGFNSKNKQLSRFLKLEYQEELRPFVNVPMELIIMSAEDRIGRGGDHIPFRRDGFAAMRFTSANEHGDASNDPGYTDRQHTTDDILGKDTDGDMIIDSFFVDFNYLGRNAVINGVGASMIAIGPKTPDFHFGTTADTGIIINIVEQTQYDTYRIAVRTNTNDWDSVYTISGLKDTIYPPSFSADLFIVSVASVDDHGIESLFTYEVAIAINALGTNENQAKKQDVELLQNRPNPFDETTIIYVLKTSDKNYNQAFIVIRDLQGKVIQRIPIQLNERINQITYEHGYGLSGIYSYSLVIDGKEISTKKMVFAY